MQFMKPSTWVPLMMLTCVLILILSIALEPSLLPALYSPNFNFKCKFKLYLSTITFIISLFIISQQPISSPRINLSLAPLALFFTVSQPISSLCQQVKAQPWLQLWLSHLFAISIPTPSSNQSLAVTLALFFAVPQIFLFHLFTIS